MTTPTPTPRTDAKAWGFRRQTVGSTESAIEWAKELERELAAAQLVCRTAKAVSENTGQSDCPTSLLVQLQEAFDKWDATCAG